MQGRSRLIVLASAALFLAFSSRAQEADTAPTKNADNTERNISDRSNETLTPMDQGNNKADLATTANIRKEVVAAKNMSVNGQNVKIITNAGMVTLRGPVNSADEKRVIAEIATRYALPGKVDNQLEVKAIADDGSQMGQPTTPNKKKGQ